MNRPKKYPSSDLKYISKEREKEVEQVFSILGLKDQGNLQHLSYLSEDYHMPFKQFSVLKEEQTIFTTSNAN